MRVNREEEKQRLLEEKNINDDHRKMLKMAAGLTTKVSFPTDSPRSSSPSVTDEQQVTPRSPTGRRPSNLTRANVKAVAAAAERKAQHAAGRKVSIGSESKGKTTQQSNSVDRLNLEDDDDDDDFDPDMMSLGNSVMSAIDLHSDRSRKKQSELRPIPNTSVKTNHGRK